MTELPIIIALMLQAEPLGNKVTLAWNPSPDLGVVGYRIYYGSSGNYSNSVYVGNVTQATLTGLPNDPLYYAATAVDTNGLESVFSNEAATLGYEDTLNYHSQTNASVTGKFTDHRYLFSETNPPLPQMNYRLRVERTTRRLTLP